MSTRKITTEVDAVVREDESGQKWVEFEPGWWMRYFDLPERMRWDGDHWVGEGAVS